MSKYNYTDVEQQINDVLVHQSQELSEISVPHMIDIDQKISESEGNLHSFLELLKNSSIRWNIKHLVE